MKIKKIKILLVILAVSIFVSVFFILRREYVVPIFMYHSVRKDNPSSTKLIVSPKAFEEQMRFLAKNSYNVISLSCLARIIQENKKIPPKTVVVTFDDGYRDNFLNAKPILEKYLIPATIFIAVDFIGQQIKQSSYFVDSSEFMSIEELKSLVDSEFIDLGIHTFSHVDLVKLDEQNDLIHEIKEPKEFLEEQLDCEMDLFSYPFGSFDKRSRSIVLQSGYVAAVATNPGRDYPKNDVFVLKRIRISEKDSNPFILWVKASGFYTLLKELRDD
ncbi:MAG: polysaccharide deacetylase family protein [Candidatus Gygaella obscura]|nr:polysaccharide deacetylase family protein [Candidatus Gygaella obscura]